MKKRLALIAIAAGLLTSHAEDIRTLDGKEYKNVTITRAEPDGLVVRTSYGIIKIFFTELSAELREKYHYDPEAATKYRQQLDADHRAREQTIVTIQQKRAQELAAAEDKAKALALVIQTPAPEHSISTGAARLHGTMLDQPVSKHWAIVGRVISKNDHGIIVDCADFVGPPHPEPGTVVFVEGDYSNVADEDRVNLNCIETGGTYRYTAVSGAAKTVRAFREAR